MIYYANRTLWRRNKEKNRLSLDFSQEQTDFPNAFVPSAPVASAWQGLLFLHLARLLLSDLSCQNLEKVQSRTQQWIQVGNDQQWELLGQFTKFFQGGHSKLDIMIDSGGRGTLFDGLEGDGLSRGLHITHAGDEVLESHVCEWRASTVQFDDTLERYKENCALIERQITLLCTLLSIYVELENCVTTSWASFDSAAVGWSWLLIVLRNSLRIETC